MTEKNEVLPGFEGPFTVRKFWPLEVEDSTGAIAVTARTQAAAQSLARILNSHAQCVEALKQITEQTDNSVVLDLAEAALKLAEGVEHG